MPKRPVPHNGLHATRLTRSATWLMSSWVVSVIMCQGSWADDAKPSTDLDWVPASQLSAEQKKRLGPSCRGLYVDPMAAEASPADLDKEPIHVDANGAHMQEGQEVMLQGNVDIRQGSRRLHANQMQYDKRNEEATLDGGVEIRQPGALVKGKNAKVNMSRNEARFNGGEFVLHATHLRGSAEQIEQKSDGKVILHNGELTSCEPGSETWILKGEKLQIDPKSGQGSGRAITISVAGIPVFYTPYIIFPVGSGRQTGLLFPTIGSSNGGLDFAQPWYWNIAPNMDATLTPRFSAGHGTMLETEWRYLHSRANNEFHVAFLPNDEGGASPTEQKLIDAGQVSEDQIHPFKGDDRWLVNWEHQGGFDAPWYTQVDFTQASDIDYLRDLSVVSFDASNNTFFNQSLVAGYNLPNWRINLRAQSYQNLLADLDDSYRQLPRVNIDGNYHWGRLGLLLNNEYVRFEHEDKRRLDNSPIITGDRQRLDYQLNWNQDWSFGFVQPALGVQALSYSLDRDNLRADVAQDPEIHTGYASLDTGLVFERDQGKQILEPRIFYLYRGYADHSGLYNLTSDGQSVNFDTTPLTFSYNQLFRDRRFAGGDRLDDSNHMALSLTSRWLDDNYQERFSASLGQLFYFENRRVFLNQDTESLSTTESDIAGQIKAAVTHALNANSDFLYNPESQQVMRVTTGLNFSQADTLYNIGYRFVREEEQTNTAVAETIDQVDVSFMRPVNYQWSVMARAFYDLDENKPLDTFAGFSYDDCCYRLRVLARRWLDSKLAALVNDDRRHYDQGIFFEVELKGLGSSGNRIQGLLEDSIIGFER